MPAPPPHPVEPKPAGGHQRLATARAAVAPPARQGLRGVRGAAGSRRLERALKFSHGTAQIRRYGVGRQAGTEAWLDGPGGGLRSGSMRWCGAEQSAPWTGRPPCLLLHGHRCNPRTCAQAAARAAGPLMALFHCLPTFACPPEGHPCGVKPPMIWPARSELVHGPIGSITTFSVQANPPTPVFPLRTWCSISGRLAAPPPPWPQGPASCTGRCGPSIEGEGAQCA